MKGIVAKAALAAALSAGLFEVANAQQQDEVYYGEMRLVAFNWCPNGWTVAAGQTLPQGGSSSNANPYLFSLIAQAFGTGGGTGNFQLPDMRGRAPVGANVGGSSPPSYAQPIGTYFPAAGSSGIPTNPVTGTATGSVTGTVGSATRVSANANFTAIGNGSVTLTAQNLPAHTHPLTASSAGGTTNLPSGALAPTFVAAAKLYAAPGAPADTPMSPNAIGPNTTTAPTPVPITVSVPITQSFTATTVGSMTVSASTSSSGPLAVSATVPAQAPSLALTWCICTTGCLYPERP